MDPKKGIFFESFSIVPTLEHPKIANVRRAKTTCLFERAEFFIVFKDYHF